MPLSLILHNFAWPAQPGASVAPALIAIEGNRIAQLGDKWDLNTLKGPATRLLDCQGGLVLPGFNDAHCHPMACAVTSRFVDCSAPGVRSIGELQARLRADRPHQPELWVRAANYDPATLREGRPPTRWELDEAVPERPVILVDKTGQHCVLNSRALAHCGLADAAVRQGAGEVRCDPVSGLPNGLVSGNSEFVARAVPPLTEVEVEAGLRQASRDFLSQGVTSLQDTSWSNGLPHFLRLVQYSRQGLFAPRLTMFAGIGAIGAFAERGLKTGSGNRFIRLGGIKIALDESTGNPQPQQEELNEVASKAHLAGFQLAFHVSDLYMLQISLRALEVLRVKASRDCLRPRFEHCPVCPPELLPRLAASGVTVVAQPGLLALSGPDHLDRTPPEQHPWLFPFRSLVESGVRLAFSSDAPLTSCRPLADIRTAVTRQVADGRTLCPEQGLELPHAFALCTAAGAFAAMEEADKGCIAVGQLADLAVLDRDAWCDGGEALAEAKVAVTILDGKVAWER